MIFNQDIITKLKQMDTRSKIITATTGSAISAQILEYTQGGYKCIFPFKTIELTQSITIPSNANVDFNNCTIKRQAGVANVFDLITNSDETNGNVNIKISNILIDGNRQVDNLDNAIDDHRFSGLKLTKVTGVSEITNVTVINTVNGEDIQTTPASGIFYIDCVGLKFKNINGWDNLGTAILNRFSTKCIIDGSLTHNNTGSGISGRGADECRFLNITTYSNGMSNLSVNGVRCIVDNVSTHNSGYSGLNIGHNTTDGVADDTVISNIQSYNNNYEGITINNANRVKIVNVNVYGNAIDNTRENIRVINSSSSKFINLVSHDCVNTGIRYYNGTGHTIDNSEFYNCSGGIYAEANVSVSIGDNVKIHDCTADGITLVSSTKCNIGSAEVYSNARYGINIVGGTSHNFIKTNIHDNITANIFESSSPTGLYYDIVQGAVEYGKNGFAKLDHYKLNVTDEQTVGLFTIAMPVHSRAVIDFTITTVYPSSTSGSVVSVKGVATSLTTGSGAMASNVSSTLISSTSLSGVASSTITPSIVNDETGDKLTFAINQNNEAVDAGLTVSVSAKITYFVGANLTKPVVTLI